MNREHHSKFFLLILAVFIIVNTFLSTDFYHRISTNISIYDSVSVHYTNLRIMTISGFLFIYNFPFIFTSLSLVILFMIALFLEKTDNKSYFLTRSAISIGIIVILLYNLYYMDRLDYVLNNHGVLNSGLFSLMVHGQMQNNLVVNFIDINLISLLVYIMLFVVFIIEEKKSK